jgi:hypothetical protein
LFEGQLIFSTTHKKTAAEKSTKEYLQLAIKEDSYTKPDLLTKEN